MPRPAWVDAHLLRPTVADGLDQIIHDSAHAAASLLPRQTTKHRLGAATEAAKLL